MISSPGITSHKDRYERPFTLNSLSPDNARVQVSGSVLILYTPNTITLHGSILQWEDLKDFGENGNTGVARAIIMLFQGHPLLTALEGTPRYSTQALPKLNSKAQNGVRPGQPCSVT